MIAAVRRFIDASGRVRLAVAFSGGIDSSVLAYELSRQRRRLAGLRLLHVDHGLQSQSGEWARHCSRMARAWRVPLVQLRADLRVPPGESVEAVAREARYALFAQALEPGEILVTAQHLDDQAETLLLQLFRGAGVPGLAAMPARAPFGRGEIARPLLGISRSQIEVAAGRQGLRWVEDPTNADTRFSRNFLRRQVLPLIREHWPGVDRALVRTTAHMAEAAALLGERARQDLSRIADGNGLSVTGLRALPASRRRNALRSFIARAGIEMPEASRLAEMVGPLLGARVDAQPEVRWSGAVLRRRAGRLELARAVEPAAADYAWKSWRWAERRVLVLNESGDRLSLVDDALGPIDLARLPHTLHLGPRRGGEVLRPTPGARTQSLKKLLQAARMTVEERACLPLLFGGDTPKAPLLAAGDRWIDASIAANVKSRRRARLVWTRRA